MKPCNEVPSGHGYCDMCAKGEYALCRYINTKGAMAKIDSLTERVRELESNINSTESALGISGMYASLEKRAEDAESRIVKLQEENSYVNDMNEMAHTRARNLEAKAKQLTEGFTSIQAGLDLLDEWSKDQDPCLKDGTMFISFAKDVRRIVKEVLR